MIFLNFLKGTKAEEKLKKVNKIINILLSLLDDKKVCTLVIIKNKELFLAPEK